MYDDLWNSSAFDLVEMTNAINLMPRRADDISLVVPFPESPVYTHDFALDLTKKTLVSLVPVTDMGAPGDILPDDEENSVRRFRLPTFTRRAFLRNAEVIGARQPGARVQRVLETERNKKFNRLQENFVDTKNVMRWESLKGPVIMVNAKGQQVELVNPLKELGMKRQGLKLKLSGDKTVNSQIVDAKVRIERILGFKPTAYKLILVEGLHSKLRDHPEYRTLETKGQDVRFSIGDGRDSSVKFAGNVEVVLYQSPYIDETVGGFLVPIFPDWARGYNGPHTSSDFEGNVLPYYVQKRNLEWNEGIEIRGSMRFITFLTRPDAVFDVIIED